MRGSSIRMEVMVTEEKVHRLQRTKARRKKTKRKAKSLRQRSDAISRTMRKTPVIVSRLTNAVSKGDIVNLRKDHDDNVGLNVRGEKRRYRKDHARLMSRRKARRKYSVKALRTALAKVEREIDKVPIFEHFIRRAYEDDQVLKALISKFLPDLKSIDAKIAQKSPYKLIIDVARPQLPGSEEA